MSSHRSLSHLINERETYRHLDLSTIHAIVNHRDDPIPPARQCADSALLAFVQLGLLRLNASRAFISLFDSRHQYVVAETTGTSGLNNAADQSSDKGLLLCGIGFPHDQGVSSYVIERAVEGLLASPDNQPPAAAAFPVIVIPDIQSDERFNSSYIVASNAEIRFYAGIPIRTSAGSIIGVFVVTDDKPRRDLSDAESIFMRQLAGTIMGHLEILRSRREEARSKRMIRGLGSFVEGRTTVEGLAEEVLPFSVKSGDGHEGDLNAQQQADLQVEDEPGRQQHLPSLPSPQTVQSSLPLFRRQQRSSPLAENTGPSGHVPESSVFPSSGAADESTGSAADTSAPPQTSYSSPEHNHLRLLSRAANIIREAVEVEGVLFFDANINTFGGLVDTNRRDFFEGSSSASYHSSSSGEEITRPSRIKAPTDAHIDKACDILAFSTTQYSSIDGAKPGQQSFRIPERFLRTILRRYPEGKIFNFDESGLLLSDTESDGDVSDSTTHTAAPRLNPPPRIRRKDSKPFSRANEPSVIIKAFPGARSLITFPLWHSNKERWFAGGIAWTRTPTRVFSVKAELSYLRAFGATIMAEVAKEEAQKADKAKSDVLGSISHELRSPLHGILGGVELLQDTDVDVFQSSILYTVERCGVTLLDTIDHLLDHAKINDLMRKERLRRQDEGPGHPAKRSAMNKAGLDGSTMSAVDVDAIVEEVVESIAASHEFQGHSDRSFNFGKDDSAPTSSAAQGLHRDPRLAKLVTIIFDVRPAVGWVFQIQIGALRRIVMNLFGNALKYTTAGHVKVSVVQSDASGNSKQQSLVKLIVEDTGKGISSNYINDGLFKPFSQEDSFSPGTGLGLSITQQIVSSLGGTIDVQSTVGQGTTITVSLTMAHTNGIDQSREKKVFVEQMKRTKGLRVSLIGFEDDSTESAAERAEAGRGWQMIRETIEQHCRDWLSMEVFSVANTGIKPDIFFATLDGAKGLVTTKQSVSILQPVIVVCPSASVARRCSMESKTSDIQGVFEYISQPCGPRKLAKTVTLCLDRWTDFHINRDVPKSPILSPLRATNPLEERPGHEAVSGHPQPALLGQTYDAMPTAPTATDSAGSYSAATAVEKSNPAAQQPRALDLTTSSQERAPGPPATSERPSPTRRLAPYLLVDDNDINLKLLSAYMRKRKLPFVAVTDGLLAVMAYKAARGNFSCVLMDIQMPTMDGIAASRAIRKYEHQEGLSPVDIIAMTGLATLETQREAEASGINKFFPKPVRLKALDGVLEELRNQIK